MTGAFWSFLFGPHLRDLSALRAAAQAIQGQVALGGQTITRFTGLDDDIREVEQASIDLRHRVTPTANVGPFVKEISRIAARLGLRDPKIVPLTPITHEKTVILPIQISYQSQYADSFDFVRAVERMLRAVRVTEFAVERLELHEQAALTNDGFSSTRLTVHLYCENIGAGSTT